LTIYGARDSVYATSSAFCATSCACSHAAGSVSVNATRNNLVAVLDDFPIPATVSALGIMRNSTFAMLCIRMNQDTIHCAALGAQKSTQAQLSAPRRNISHLIHRGGAFLAVSWSHHKSQRLDRPSGFLAGSRGVGDVASARSRGLRAGG